MRVLCKVTVVIHVTDAVIVIVVVAVEAALILHLIVPIHVNNRKIGVNVTQTLCKVFVATHVIVVMTLNAVQAHLVHPPLQLIGLMD